jgi:hypothetical protein
MVKSKTTFSKVCEFCDKKIIGFSEHHAAQNLIIHQKTSEQCKYIRKLLEKRGK